MQSQYARSYRTLWERHWWWRSREAYLLGWLRDLHEADGRPEWRLLDIGCGDGLFFGTLSRFGRVEGLEPDATLLSDPRRRGAITIGTLGPGFNPGPVYDLALMLDVLEHIPDDRAALESARGTLRPGGRLVLTVPALDWLWSRHDEANEHHRRYRRPGLRRLLRDAGFEIEAVRYFFAWTVAPLLVRRWLAPARGKAAADYAVKVPPAPLNRALTLVSRADHALGRFVQWPIGGSLLAVARNVH